MNSLVAVETNSDLSDLIDRALNGEGITLSRDGTAVAEIRAVKVAPIKKQMPTLAFIKANRVTLGDGTRSVREILNVMQDE